jgi:lysophospholipase L1-like esterase
MVKPYRIALAIMCALSAAYHSASAANPPKVVFIGDYLTANWPLPANSNWTNLGYPTPDTFQASGSSSYWLSNFQSVIDLHPDIVHILVGAEDAAIVDDGVRPIFGSIFANNIESMVAQAKAANIKVILGTTPAGAPDNIGITQINAFVESYGAANGVPVINYAHALCTCVNSTMELGNGKCHQWHFRWERVPTRHARADLSSSAAHRT